MAQFYPKSMHKQEKKTFDGENLEKNLDLA